MLSNNNNCEKMVAIPPTSSANNQCPQPQNEMIGCSSGRVLLMEKAAGGENQLLLQQQQQQQQLKCPRCESSNTKFCYYNNYSLSQPRHFCKACKRYWTRGGTLRNIPVGGSSRSRNHRNNNNNNKRFLKTSSPTTSTPQNYISQHPRIHSHTTAISTSKNHLISPFFSHGGLLSNINNSPNCVNLPFSRFNNYSSSGGYDLTMNGIASTTSTGLGFPSSTDDHNGYRGNEFSSIFGSSSLNCASSNTPLFMMPSLLSSFNLVQHKFINHGLKDGGQPDHGTNNSSTIQGLASLPVLEQISNGIMNGDVQESRSLEWMNNIGGFCGQNQMEHVGLFDPSKSLYWNTASAATTGLWSNSTDQPNIAPSLTSL